MNVQGCQHRAVILAKKRSHSSNWRMFTTLTDHRIKLMSSGHCSPCIHEAPQKRLPAPTPRGRVDKIERGTRAEPQPSHTRNKFRGIHF
ncbi:MAG: hypothetical protein K8R19_00145 [Methanosarcinales archaeon]|nr:hypothetical protein [Methanosarcinales archaeon]